MKDVDVLEKAAILIEENGLAMGVRRDSWGYCALGALNQARFGDPWGWRYPENVLKRLCTMLGFDTYGVEDGHATAIANWSNDQSDKKVVTSAFRKLARILRAENVSTIS